MFLALVRFSLRDIDGFLIFCLFGSVSVSGFL